MKKIVLVFGLISGLISSSLMLITVPMAEKIGFETGMIVGYASILAASLLIYFGVRSYRDNVLGGGIGFGRAFGTGMLIASISGLLYTGTWHFVSQRYFPDFMEKYQAHELEGERAKGATAAQIEAKVVEQKKMAEMYRNPFWRAAFTFMEPLPVSLVVALLSAWVLSRRKEQPVAVPAG